MRRIRRLIYVVWAVSLWGCQASFDAIPVGRWEGAGTWRSICVNRQGHLERKSGEYTTTVVVTKRAIADQTALVVTVQSVHPEGSAFDVRCVHVLMALKPLGSKPVGRLLCENRAVIDGKKPANLDSPPDADLEALLKTDPLPPATLSCLGPLRTLRVSYVPVTSEAGKKGDVFKEMYEFMGKRLTKKGYMRVSKDYLGWNENLRKVR